ncbi:MAG: HAMP domain-containing protein, partial [Puniceicoccales bacterium]
MFALRHSIQWRIFAYYTGLIFLALVVLVTAFYYYEKQDRERLTSMTMQARLIRIIPMFFHPGSDPHSRGRAKSHGRLRDRMQAEVDPNAESAFAENHPATAASSGAGSWPNPYPPSELTGQLSPNRPIVETELGRHIGAKSDSPRFGPGTPERAERDLYSLEDEGYFLCAMDYEKGIVYMTKNFPGSLIDRVPEFGPATWTADRNADYLWVGTQVPESGYLLLGVPMSRLHEQIQATLVKAIGIGGGVLVIISLLGYALIHISLRPIKHISEAASRIAQGDMNEKIDTTHVRSELGELAGVLNQTFGRLSDAVKRQIQFTSDASHELRTPVAAILAECQFSLKRERTPERYRETIEVCHESAQIG